jgi:hypothetical protein
VPPLRDAASEDSGLETSCEAAVPDRRKLPLLFAEVDFFSDVEEEVTALVEDAIGIFIPAKAVAALIWERLIVVFAAAAVVVAGVTVVIAADEFAFEVASAAWAMSFVRLIPLASLEGEGEVVAGVVGCAFEACTVAWTIIEARSEVAVMTMGLVLPLASVVGVTSVVEIFFAGTASSWSGTVTFRLGSTVVVEFPPSVECVDVVALDCVVEF